MNSKKAQIDILNRTEIDNGDGTSSLRISGNLSIGGNRSLIVIPVWDLSTGELNYSTNLASDFKLLSIVANFNVAIVEDVMLYYDVVGTTQDKLIYKEITSNNDGVTGEKDYSFYPDSDMVFMGSQGRQLNLRITNNGGSGLVYAEIIVEVLP